MVIACGSSGNWKIHVKYPNANLFHCLFFTILSSIVQKHSFSFLTNQASSHQDVVSKVKTAVIKRAIYSLLYSYFGEQRRAIKLFVINDLTIAVNNSAFQDGKEPSLCR